ncbi:DUF3850 domain-containing protein [Anaerocolumna aminovalerica]|uniref:ASCH/PUA domain-containing protein n=1 Tax=Anaerocolumna aminovalerica TaxID=1527 RepID=UPI001C0F37CA|nr:ASCH/PUA domain-containing protein [Anaerocolumna aminovalerica]MBU5331435.1 DUF3850 domain-containing protein [Anaerocolumna aminovalerica]
MNIEKLENNQVIDNGPSYQVIKNIIKGKLNSVAESFVAIGYQLKKVRDGELYKEDGYSDIYDFALKEYNLTKSNVSRFMSINDKFSENGNSPFLIPEYAGYGSSKLSEMLTLDNEELKLISERTTVKEIREFKKTMAEASENETVATSQQTSESLNLPQSNTDFERIKSEDWESFKSIILEYFKDQNKRGQLKELRDLTLKSISESEIAVIVNPSGHSMFKKGIIIAFLEKKIIRVKKFGGLTLEFSYTDFLDAAEEVFNFESEDPWAEYFGEPEKESKDSEKESEDDEEKPEPKKLESKKAIKQQEHPKSSSPTKEETKEEINIPGQKNIDEYPEYIPDTKEIEKVEGEVIQDSIKESQSEEEQTVHDLKTESIYFSDVLSGLKHFELRINDRNFKVGDILILNETINNIYTGRKIERRITYILENYQGLLENYCILGIAE